MESEPLELVSTPWAWLALLIFAGAYVLVIAEEFIHLRKSKPVVFAAGLFRRPSPREIGVLVPPEFRRRFRGRLIVHDADVCRTRCRTEYGNPCTRFCPANV